MLDQKISDKDVKKILNATFVFSDLLAVMQHHDAITGTELQYVAIDYQWRLHKRQQASIPPYNQWISDRLAKETGIKVKKGEDILMCTGSQNDTVSDCPVDEF